MIRLTLLLLLMISEAWGFVPMSLSVGSENHARRGHHHHHLSARSTTVMKASKQQHEQQEERVDRCTTPYTHDFDLEFPTFRELMLLSPGDYIASDQIMNVKDTYTNTTHDFQLLLYPRGGGHSPKTNKPLESDSGFGMSYKLLFGDQSEKVGLYLQYLSDVDTVDAMFSLLLVGNQLSGRKFNVEWSSGMRFCPLHESNLSQGMANDFGAHLMQTNLLPEFLGISEENENGNASVKAKVNITIHPRITESERQVESSTNGNHAKAGLLQSIGLPLRDIRQSNQDSTMHDAEQVRVGKVVVPVLSKLEQRPRMFQLGAYPGVEYRIMQIFNANGNQVFASEPGADYVMRPIYPLVSQLERTWPVRIPEEEIPKLLTPSMYNVISAIGSLVTAVGGLVTAFLISQAISLFFIPSRSMDPTLQVKDVLVVEKVSPRILGVSSENVGSVILFSPPTRLRDIVSSSGGRIADRDLFVKRIAAGPGDTVTVESSGAIQINGAVPKENRDMCGAEPLRLIERFIQPGSFTVEEGEVFVLGDCSSVSVDSRVWGPLQAKEIVGKPLMRIWPLERFGAVPSLPTTSVEWSE